MSTTAAESKARRAAAIERLEASRRKWDRVRRSYASTNPNPTVDPFCILCELGFRHTAANCRDEL